MSIFNLHSNVFADYREFVRSFSTVADDLQREFPKPAGDSACNLKYMRALAEAFPDPKILHALRAKLGWTHFRQIIYLDDPLKRDFYAADVLDNWRAYPGGYPERKAGGIRRRDCADTVGTINKEGRDQWIAFAFHRFVRFFL